MGMKVPWRWRRVLVFLIFFIGISHGQDYGTGDYDATPEAPPPPGMDTCNGVYLTYSFSSKEKELPYLKNKTAQAWAFTSEASILNTGTEEIQGWKLFVGFHHNEILVSADGAVLLEGSDFPSPVGKNGTTLAGSTMPDLQTAIDTAGDFTQMQVRIQFKGTLFGLTAKQAPMPKNIKLANDGYICPKAKKMGATFMYSCCKKDPKFKVKDKTKTKYLPRQYGDLSMVYDVLQAFGNNYQAQVTIDNNNPLGRLDHWNLTWEWARGEFIYNMRGAYTRVKNYDGCIYGQAGQYYKDFDFSQVLNCEKKPTISDLPATFKNDSKVGKLPFCCRNGSVVPTVMDENRARSIFQLQVYKLPPDMTRTAITPPMKWKINGNINPDYQCGPPIRIQPTEFPDPMGLQATSTAMATWQVICNITRPKPKQARCCVSFSSYYNDSVIPCNTCACGCDEDKKCNPNGKALLLPSEALLVPFENRTLKAKAWYKHIKRKYPSKPPCPDNCGVSINWHVNGDYKDGWSARITLFNWDDISFEDWFAAFRLDKTAKGFEKVYSFNGSLLTDVKNTVFIHGLEGLNFLMGETNGSSPRDPKVPGKQQSVISFKKKYTSKIDIKKGDGYPSRVYFNGEECALPKDIPRLSGAHKSIAKFLSVMFIALCTLALLMTDFFH
ncbi:hypothetical protein ACFE04_006150 [Oxalis oulophora]